MKLVLITKCYQKKKNKKLIGTIAKVLKEKIISKDNYTCAVIQTYDLKIHNWAYENLIEVEHENVIPLW